MTEQPEWLSKYGKTDNSWAMIGVGLGTKDDVLKVLIALVLENQSQSDRIARLEAGQRELEARLGDGE